MSPLTFCLIPDVVQLPSVELSIGMEAPPGEFLAAWSASLQFHGTNVEASDRQAHQLGLRDRHVVATSSKPGPFIAAYLSHQGITTTDDHIQSFKGAKIPMRLVVGGQSEAGAQEFDVPCEKVCRVM